MSWRGSLAVPSQYYKQLRVRGDRRAIPLTSDALRMEDVRSLRVAFMFDDVGPVEAVLYMELQKLREAERRLCAAF
jgi:hypothetical protein